MGMKPIGWKMAPFLLGGVTAVVLLSGILMGGFGHEARAQQNKGGAGGRAAPVVVEPVREVRQAPMSEYTGLIEPASKAFMAADVAGRVVKVMKKTGARVRVSEVLAELDNPTLRQDLAVLEARLNETRAEWIRTRQQHKRVESLYLKKLTSAQQFEDSAAGLGVSRARVERGEAEVKKLKDQLGSMVLRSPLDGQIISSNIELGQWISPNTPLFEIYNFDYFEVVVGIPGRMIGKVPETGPVSVRIPEFGKSLKGRILGVVRHVNRSTGNFEVRVGMDNAEGLPLSGMVARVDLPVGPQGLLLTVPRDAVVRRGERTHVVIVDEGKAKILPVQVAGNLGDDVIVRGQGLQAEQLVVVRGNERLFPGMPVRIDGGNAGGRDNQKAKGAPASPPAQKQANRKP